MIDKDKQKYLLKVIIGKTSEEAKNIIIEAGYRCRIVPVGGIITMDYNRYRITLSINKDDIVVIARIG